MLVSAKGETVGECPIARRMCFVSRGGQCCSHCDSVRIVGKPSGEKTSVDAYACSQPSDPDPAALRCSLVAEPRPGKVVSNA